MSNAQWLIDLELLFHDELALRLAGITAPHPAKVKAIPGALPRTGDIVRFAGVNYASGELALFRVVSIAHLFGGRSVQRIQASLELVVAHQP